MRLFTRTDVIYVIYDSIYLQCYNLLAKYISYINYFLELTFYLKGKSSLADFIRSSPISKLLCITAKYKALAALSLARIPLSSSFNLKRIVSKNTLQLNNISASNIYIAFRTAHNTIVKCFKLSLNILISLV